jgi:hypothetical protein
MAEPRGWLESDYINEAKRIVREYLSGLTWIRSHRNIIYREIRPAFEREEEEEKFRALTQKEEDVEWVFGQDVDRWRKSEDANRKIVLEEIVKALGNRRDLGFFGKRIVDRLKREIR